MDGTMENTDQTGRSIAGVWVEDGTRYRFRLWVDPDRGTWGVALPDFYWSAGDLGLSLTHGEGEWFAAHGLGEADARNLAHLVASLRWFLDVDQTVVWPPAPPAEGGPVQVTVNGSADPEQVAGGDRFMNPDPVCPPMSPGRRLGLLAEHTRRRRPRFIPQALPGMARAQQRGLGALVGGEE
jgi:hypothetical protein